MRDVEILAWLKAKARLTDAEEQLVKAKTRLIDAEEQPSGTLGNAVGRVSSLRGRSSTIFSRSLAEANRLRPVDRDSQTFHLTARMSTPFDQRRLVKAQID